MFQETSLKVEVQNGWVKGAKMADSLYSWRGIPYAKPPIGNLRFEVNISWIGNVLN